MRTLIFVVVALCLSAPVSAQTCSGSPEQVVTCEQVKAGGAAGLTQPTQLIAFLRNVAASLNAVGHDGYPFGVLKKDGGHNCGGYSCDIICSGNGPSQRQWDVLEDAGGASKPRWDGPLSTIAVRPCEIVTSPVPPTPTPTPDPIDLTAVYARLRALENATEALFAEVRDVRAELRAESQDIRAIINALPTAGPLPKYRGKLWGIAIISEPCPTCK